MKTRFFLIVLLMGSVFSLYSCDDDDNYTPDDVVVNAFKARYPEASRVEWETKSGFKVADFRINSKEAEAWFETDGTWVMTETDVTFNELPSPVQTAFNESIYSKWRIDDIDKLERSNAATIYIIEVEQGDQEYDLHFTEDGILLNDATGNNSGNNNNNNNGYLPTTIPEDNRI